MISYMKGVIISRKSYSMIFLSETNWPVVSGIGSWFGEFGD